jgi:homoserine kinase
MQQVTVRVPASTSNLGPGFDCLGVALRIYTTVTVTRGRSARQPHPEIVFQASGRFFKQAGRRAFRFSVSVVEEIPQSRGLGSSATIRLGILHALNRLSGDPLDRLTLFRLCAELERHPDNAAPATFGGFTVVGTARRPDSRKLATGQVRPTGELTVLRFDVSQRLHFVLLVPEFEIKTSLARRILPPNISRAAAVENCANACTITAAFASKDYEKLGGVFTDRLHQPFRSKLIPFLSRVTAAAEKAGALGAFLSGSGSTICAITLRHPGLVAAVMKRAARSISSRTIVTHADNRGARIIRSQITNH